MVVLAEPGVAHEHHVAGGAGQAQAGPGPGAGEGGLGDHAPELGLDVVEADEVVELGHDVLGGRRRAGGQLRETAPADVVGLQQRAGFGAPGPLGERPFQHRLGDAGVAERARGPGRAEHLAGRRPALVVDLHAGAGGQAHEEIREAGGVQVDGPGDAEPAHQVGVRRRQRAGAFGAGGGDERDRREGIGQLAADGLERLLAGVGEGEPVDALEEQDAGAGPLECVGHLDQRVQLPAWPAPPSPSPSRRGPGPTPRRRRPAPGRRPGPRGAGRCRRGRRGGRGARGGGGGGGRSARTPAAPRPARPGPPGRRRGRRPAPAASGRRPAGGPVEPAPRVASGRRPVSGPGREGGRPPTACRRPRATRSPPTPAARRRCSGGCGCRSGPGRRPAAPAGAAARPGRAGARPDR